MFKKIINTIKQTLIEEYKFIIVLLLITIILNIPLNYYITVGGGISDAADRITVDKKHESKGSFNISYVTQLSGNVLTYALSYIIPKWERESADKYKYDEEESIDNIEFRNKLDLDTANATATYWAYTLANKPIKEVSKKLYIIATYPKEHKTDLKVGDEIISVDNNKYNTLDDLGDYIQTKNVGDKVTVEVIRKKKHQEIKTKIYERKKRKIIGVTLQYAKKI